MVLKRFLLAGVSLVGLYRFTWSIGGNETRYIRRRLASEVYCLALLKHILYEKDAVNPGPPSEWECQLLQPFDDRGNGNILKLDGLDTIDNSDIVKQFISGDSRIRIPGGFVEGSSIIIPPGTPIVVETNGDSSSPNNTSNTATADNIFQIHRRRLSEGSKKLIVIRVVDRNGVKTPSSLAQISDSVFGTSGDPHNLASQYDACSYGKLRFEPVRELSRGDPRINVDGVYEVKISLSASNVANTIIREEVTDQLNREWPGTRLPENSDAGGRLDSSIPFDHMMYCMPPGTKGSWVAYAFANSWLTVYNDGWCNSLSAGVHELGHNLNLGHSGDGKNPSFPESEYGDQSGMMGYSYNRDDTPIMCFNAAKSWQLNWYRDRVVTVAPLSSSWTGRINGISDYDSFTGYPVLVKIETGLDTDFYMNFNRKTGINSGTLEGGNRVLVTAQGKNGVWYSNSKLQATLASGSTYTIDNFGNSGIRVRVTVNTINLSASPGYAQVTVGPSCTSNTQCRPSNRCTQDNWVCDSSTRFCRLSGQPSDCNCDYQCDAQYESARDCPSDCGRRFDFSTTFESNNGHTGNMFHIRALKSIDILGFKIHVRNAAKLVNVRIYAKRGSYQGFERNANAWTLLQSTPVVSKGTNALTELPLLSEPYRVGAGATNAFYITLDTQDIRYTSGSSLGRLYRSDSGIQFFEGIGTSYPLFGESFTPRIWNGRITYVEASNSSGPTPRIDPPPSPTPRPPTPPNNSIRTLETTMAQNNGQAGCMFELKARRDIEIVGFEIHARSKDKAIRAQVYRKTGSYRGSERNAAAWQRIQTTIMTSKGLNVLTRLPLLSSPVEISRNSRVSFYVTLETNDMKYTGGTQEGAEFASDANLIFYEGTGNKYPFGDPYRPRVFNGRIKYKVLANAEEAGPTPSPTVTFDLYDLTMEPTPGPTPGETLLLSDSPSLDASGEPSMSLEPSQRPSHKPSLSLAPSTEPTILISTEPSFDTDNLSDIPTNDPTVSLKPTTFDEGD